MELGIAELDTQLCDHLPCSFFYILMLALGSFVVTPTHSPPAKSAAKAPIYSVGVGPFLFYLVTSSLSLVLLLCIYVLHLYLFLIHPSLLPVSISMCFLPIRS